LIPFKNGITRKIRVPLRIFFKWPVEQFVTLLEGAKYATIAKKMIQQGGSLF
jgi:hypothetical protein